jgi:hypothetical protein
VGNAIFISYRRDDSEGEAGRLFDDLSRAFGKESVFMDVTGIRPGADFRHVIDDSVAHCGVLLSVIGPNWTTIANPDGTRRLEDPNDFVALEIASALKRDVPVIPVLVHGAHMPAVAQLPDSLKDLCYRNSVEISHTRWNSDVDLLIDALKSYVTPNPATQQEAVHPAVPMPLPAPHPVTPAPAAPAKKSKLKRNLGIAAAAVVLLIVILYFVGSSEPDNDTNRSITVTSKPATGPSDPETSFSSTEADEPAPTGTWTDPDPRANNSLLSVTIAGTGNNLTMHAAGTCEAPCDWGTQPAQYDGEYVSATFNPTDPSGGARATKVKAHLKGTDLEVDIHNTFSDANGIRENQVKLIFEPAR